MKYEAVSVTDFRHDFEIFVESFDGNPIEWRAVVKLLSHSGIGSAAGISIEIFVSSKTGEAKYTCQPAFWGTRLPNFVPALHQIVDEYYYTHVE